ncbi:MAG: C-terminal binding protein [Clostridiaceae bacterium]
MYKVVYYNMNQTLDYENQLLEEWNIKDIELVEIKNGGKKLKSEYIAQADGIMLDYDTVPRELMQQLPNCKIIALQSIGYNTIDIEAATENNTCVTNVPGFCVEEVALHAVGLMIDLVRKISYYDRSVRKGYWDPFMGEKTYRMTGKTIGLIFFGAIPQAMMPMLKALKLNILVYAPRSSKEFIEKWGAEKAETLEELMEKSDFVSIHTPLTPETAGMISEEQINRMKPAAFLINTSRGAIVDEKALIKALKEKRIAGAGLDVIEDEKNHNSEILQLENVVVTPHAAFISEDSLLEGRRRALEQVVMRLSKGILPEHLVNKDCKIV